MGKPRSIGGLDVSRLGTLTSRVHSTLLRHTDIRNNRFNPGFNVMRTAVTLRCMFSSPRSGFIFSISRRSCPRGVLANEGRTCVTRSRCSSMANCADPVRDRRSVFAINRASASIDLTYKLTENESMAGNGNGIVTLVNSNSVDNNRTLRNFGITNRVSSGLVVITGSGRVSVTRGRNKLCGGLGLLHSASNGTRYGLFGSVKLSCMCIGSNGGVRRLVGTFGSMGSVSRPIIIRVGALGNGNCGPTRASGRD